MLGRLLHCIPERILQLWRRRISFCRVEVTLQVIPSTLRLSHHTIRIRNEIPQRRGDGRHDNSLCRTFTSEYLRKPL